MSVGEKITQLIREKGLTQKEFSARTGIPQSTISDWKRKKQNPSSDKIPIICEVLGVDPNVLFTGTGCEKYNDVEIIHVCKNSSEYDLLVEYGKLNDRFKERLHAYACAMYELQKNE